MTFHTQSKNRSEIKRDIGRHILNGLIFNIREIKIHVYGIRQTANVSWELLKIENKQVKTVQNDSFG